LSVKNEKHQTTPGRRKIRVMVVSTGKGAILTPQQRRRKKRKRSSQGKKDTLDEEQIGA